MLKIVQSGFLLFLATLVLSACGATKHSNSKNKSPEILTSLQDENHFLGVLVVNPNTKDTLYKAHAKKYFTPASTAKIFTLYTALKLLPERIPVLRYISRKDTIHFEGTGDPTQLHHFFKDSTAIQFLKNKPNLIWHPNNYQGGVLGPGWAWEDYQYYYQVERNTLPLYGNVVRIYQTEDLQVAPSIFKENVIDLDESHNRAIESNTFYYASSRKDTVEIPYRTNSTKTKELLETALQRPIAIQQSMLQGEKSILYGIPSDSVYKRMMHESDNFLADQLLVLSSGMLSDSLAGKKAREYILENALTELKQKPRWVDGSGLSRYNLFTPESMVYVLEKLRQEIPQKRLLQFFVPNVPIDQSKPANNDQEAPYVYAKSGSVGNNYSLNGYLLTKSGKLLIFSIMNNHFRASSTTIRIRVQQLLKHIYENN